MDHRPPIDASVAGTRLVASGCLALAARAARRETGSRVNGDRQILKIYESGPDLAGSENSGPIEYQVAEFSTHFHSMCKCHLHIIYLFIYLLLTTVFGLVTTDQ